MSRYAVDLLLPEKIENELDRLRGEYSRYIKHKIFPHITLKNTFKTKVDQKTIIDMLTAVARGTSPFKLVLNEIRYFEVETNVAFIGIANDKPLIDLRADISRRLEGLTEVVEQYREIDLPENYIPHLTIWEGIPNEIFPDYKKRLTDCKIDYEIEIASFTLFRKDMDEIWKLAHTFELFRK